MTSDDTVDRPPMTLLLIDGMHMLRRTFEACRNEFPDEMKDGEIHAAKSVDSTIASIRRAIRETRATHIILAMDTPGVKNWRHAIYPEYKANRPPMPEPLKLEVPNFCNRAKNELGIQSFSAPGFEADDLICSAVKKWCATFPRDSRLSSEEPDVVIITSDKDIYALVSDRVVIRDHFGKTWHDLDYTQAKFGVLPSQISDYLALIGDTPDNIPGVHLIGPKTARQLLARYGSAESVLLNASLIENKRVAKLIEAGVESLKISMQLTHMREDVRFGCSWKDFRFAGNQGKPRNETPARRMAFG